MMNVHGTWIKYDADNCPLPKDAFIDGLVAGPNGRIWVTVHRQETIIRDHRIISSAAWMDGILLFDDDRWTWFPWSETELPQHIFDPHIVCDSAGQLWLFDGLVARFDGHTSEVFHAKERGLPPQPLMNSRLAAGPENEMWLTTRLHGIYRFKGDVWQRLALDNAELNNVPILDVRVNNVGHVWFALGLGNEISFGWYDGAHWEEYTRVPSTKVTHMRAFVIDQEDRLWVGWSEEGLWVLDRHRKQWTKYTTKNSALPSNTIQYLELDRSGRLWVGAGDGIAVFDGKESVCWWKIKPGIPDDPLNRRGLWLIRQSGEGPVGNVSFPTVFDKAVVDTQGRIWASSGNGVSVFTEA
jgi:ligand-binding sensor domain-containing protein